MIKKLSLKLLPTRGKTTGGKKEPYKPGDIITFSDGKQYVVGPNGAWHRK